MSAVEMGLEGARASSGPGHGPDRQRGTEQLAWWPSTQEPALGKFGTLRVPKWRGGTWV